MELPHPTFDRQAKLPDQLATFLLFPPVFKGIVFYAFRTNFMAW
jgi:hypothetical protein